ncbi:MAG: C10 family peptidase [Muribaculaceae bacterium]|nr:C10 family peptidase [Muribaculaceae bacterium]
MQRRLFLFVLACITSMTAAWAGPVDEGQARVIAERFATNHAMSPSGLEMVKKSTKMNAPQPNARAAYYVFNGKRADSGFIIVAGDDRAPAVLGYSDQGTFDPANVAPALADLLESYVEQIEALEQGAQPRLAVASRQPISPLLTSMWAQGGPYNNLLPFVGNSHAVTGCVATAMAQVMYYWQWPVRPTMTIPSYTTGTAGIYMPELSPVDFNWSGMNRTYFLNDTLSEAGQAVAKLMLYCAQSVEMDFKESTSGATTTYTPLAFSKYFGYDPGAHSLNRLNYTNQEWENIIYAELQAARPVIFSGSKATGGHSFVCDGCDNSGLFHINWGWNGKSNGYFLLNVLNPDLEGTGSASGAYGYINNLMAVVGIRPGNETASEVMMTSANMALNSYTGTRSSSSGSFSATMTGRFYNLTSSVFAVDFGWGLYQGNTFVSKLYSVYSNSSTPGRFFTLSERQFSFGAGITSGTYRIVPICSERGAGNWKPCVGSDINYIEVVINNNTCTFKGHGIAGTPDYTVNSITMQGNKHPNRPMDITVNLTNNGDACNNLLYMFVGSTSTGLGIVSLEKGQTGDIPFRFVPTAAGTYTIKFSFNEDGSSPIATRTLVINEMPTANLSASLTVLNLTDPDNKIITSDKFSVQLNIKNNGTQTYSEDISITLYKNSYGGYGTAVQSKNRFIELAPGASTTVQFDMDNVFDGWRFFVKSYYYSAGSQVDLVGTTFHTIIFPEVPDFMRGDVDGDNNVSISDVTALINYLLTDNATGINLQAANCDLDDVVGISDVTTLINYLLTDTWN